MRLMLSVCPKCLFLCLKTIAAPGRIVRRTLCRMVVQLENGTIAAGSKDLLDIEKG